MSNFDIELSETEYQPSVELTSTSVTITDIKQISGDCYKITISSGSAFFIRAVYLQQIREEELVLNATFSESFAWDLVRAGLCFSAEKKGMEYLARGEQSRYLLSLKLAKKGFDKESVSLALGYLENKKYLDDGRFAEAWLRNRMISKYEGPTKLCIGLQSRGISRDVASLAIQRFLIEYPEEYLLVKASEKFLRLGKKEEKLISALQKSGFSWQMIKKHICSMS